MKLILTDLDETLLHSDKTISDYSAKIFAECQKKGILVGFCTSRGKPNTDEFVGKIIPEKVIANMKKGLSTCKGTPVILFHDRKSTAKLLPAVLDYLKSEGYTMLPLSEKQEAICSVK